MNMSVPVSYNDQLEAAINRHQACGRLFNQRAEYAKQMDQPGAELFFPFWSDEQCQDVIANHYLLRSQILVNLYASTRGLMQARFGHEQDDYIEGFERVCREQTFASIAAAKAMGRETGIPAFSHQTVTENNFMPLFLASLLNFSIALQCRAASVGY